MVGVSCASMLVRSTRLAGFCCTADESSTCAMRPPARPRSKVPGGGLRKPSPCEIAADKNVSAAIHKTRLALFFTFPVCFTRFSCFFIIATRCHHFGQCLSYDETGFCFLPVPDMRHGVSQATTMPASLHN